MLALDDIQHVLLTRPRAREATVHGANGEEANTQDADIAIGARMPHAGECTVHPIGADSAAIAMVVSAAIPATTRVGPPRHALCLLVPTTAPLCR